MGYGDGSVRTVEIDGVRTKRSGTAANVYEGEDAEPTLQFRRAGPSNACSFTAETGTIQALVNMADIMVEQNPQNTVVVLILDSLAKIKQLAKGPAKVSDWTAAKDWNDILKLVNKHNVKVVIAHYYSHTISDVRMETVDNDAKSAAEEGKQSQVNDAARWWKDDARTSLSVCLQARRNKQLEGSLRGKYGPSTPTVWGKTTFGMSLSQTRRLAQLRVFCCSGLGGHLKGRAHMVTCGLCNKECGRALDSEASMQSPIEHLFTCPELHATRTRLDVKSVKALWNVNPATVMKFVEEATLLSRTGRFHKNEFTLGAKWKELKQTVGEKTDDEVATE
jgi:hypothetical protein